MYFPRPKFIRNNDIDLAIYEHGDIAAPALLLLHGWPEMAYSWANMIKPLARAGYRVIAMDLRGFGHSDAPKGVTAYRMDRLVSDVQAVLDRLGIRESVIIGHDWGGIIAWAAARLLEERVRGVISICTPHMKRPPADPIDILRQRHGDEHYFVRFNDDKTVEKIFEQDPLAVFKMLFRSTPKAMQASSEMYYLVAQFEQYLQIEAPDLPRAVMSMQDMQVYAGAYIKSGFHGGINLYRNTSDNWRLSKDWGDDISQPSLMISAQNDLFLPPEMTDPMVNMVADLERVIIPDCGHWAMWEQPDIINKTMIEWLLRKMGLRFF